MTNQIKKIDNPLLQITRPEIKKKDFLPSETLTEVNLLINLA